jgi:hypothetical protein
MQRLVILSAALEERGEPPSQRHQRARLGIDVGAVQPIHDRQNVLRFLVVPTGSEIGQITAGRVLEQLRTVVVRQQPHRTVAVEERERGGSAGFVCDAGHGEQLQDCGLPGSSHLVHGADRRRGNLPWIGQRPARQVRVEWRVSPGPRVHRAGNRLLPRQELHRNDPPCVASFLPGEQDAIAGTAATARHRALEVGRVRDVLDVAKPRRFIFLRSILDAYDERHRPPSGTLDALQQAFDARLPVFHLAEHRRSAGTLIGSDSARLLVASCRLQGRDEQQV